MYKIIDPNKLYMYNGKVVELVIQTSTGTVLDTYKHVAIRDKKDPWGFSMVLKEDLQEAPKVTELLWKI
jgi:hypothetical protein